MVSFTILAGGFSTFIATYVFNNDTSSLTLTKQTTTGNSPSWIASHPQNSSILYATNEITPVGNLQSFLVDADGAVTLVDTVATGGSGPTFTNPLSTGEVSAMNFGSPNADFVATVPNDPLHFVQGGSPVVEFPVNGGPSNPHMSLEHNGEVFVTDLGADKVWRLVNDGAPGKFRVQGQINIDPGSGPRHMAIQDDILFIVHEKTSTLTAQQIPAAPNGTTFPLLANVSIIPSDFANAHPTSVFAGAEILLSEPSDKFPDPLIYVSNRNLGPDLDPRGDSIAIFEFQSSSTAPTPPVGRRFHARRGAHTHFTRDVSHGDAGCQVVNTLSGNFTLHAQVFTGLTQIRSMALGKVADGGDEFLIAGANVAGGVGVWRRVDAGRDLELVVRNEEVANRTSFVFV
ncbi:hypothetical protein BDN70DRAFT_884575 [Pholiota conissans]|uniref:Isomerase YbhE n=1 Tax=Pholiota conissans TaxID=109636 RepID=A0A9P5YRS4_9AGAR|nr:hypothetical protein BDN70DRAFT_884575 [Pholiota conissans]